MCGRMTSTTSAEKLAEHFDAETVTPEASELPARYNVAPTQEILVIAEHKGSRRLGTMRWGLVPFFAKDPSGAARMINARAEAVAEKPSYRNAFLRRRCLIPADGFYEWKKLGGSKTKQPWYFEASSGEVLALAGLWELWRDPSVGNADPIVSCTIITAEANGDIGQVHDRMPLVLPRDEWAEWLDRDNHDGDGLQALLRPPRLGLLVGHPVSDRVNSVRNDDSSLIEKASEAKRVND